LKEQVRRAPRALALALVVLSVLMLSACGSGALSGAAQGGGGGGEEAAAEAEGPTRVAVQLNWFPEPEHGNLFAAKEAGYYEEAGLDVELKAGGPQISSTQLVASGQADFGVGDGDSIAQAQAEGIPVVAVAANFQTFPQILMSHASEGVEGPEDFSGRTAYIAPAANYWEYLTAEYGIEPKKIVAYSGSLAPFIEDKEAINQGYITSEPYILEEEEGVDVNTQLVADFGYNPYVVLFTTQRMVEEEPETVRSFIEASMRGWDYYYENTQEVNRAIGEQNRELSLDVMAYSAETERDLIYTDETEENGLGYMSEERWSTIVDQLVQTDNLKEDVDPASLYTNEFLPGPQQ